MIQNKLDDIYLMRRNSISSDGEFGEGNLLFKEIRNLGLKDKLSQKIQELTSADLTLEGLV